MHGSNSSTNKETAFPGNHILKCAYLLSCIRTGSYSGSPERDWTISRWVHRVSFGVAARLTGKWEEPGNHCTCQDIVPRKTPRKLQLQSRHYRWHEWYQSCGSKHKEYFPKCQTIRLTTHVAFLYVAWKSIKFNVMYLRVWQLDSFISAAHITALLASGSGVISSAAVWPRLLLGDCLLR